MRNQLLTSFCIRIFTGILVFGTIFPVCEAYCADGVTIGVSPFDTDLNVLESSHVAAALARQATLSGLTKVTVQGLKESFSLGLARNLRVASDYSKWSFLLRSDAFFQSGEKVSLPDVEYSLKRCRDKGRLPLVASIAMRQVGVGDGVELWIDIGLTHAGDGARDFPKSLSACPILEREAGALFGRDLGKGTNIIGSGAFKIKHVRHGREIELVRVLGGDLDRDSPPSVTIRSFVDPQQALTALRVGTLDAFFTDDQKVLALGQKDDTLTSLLCGELTLLKRRGFTMGCPAVVDFNNLKYLYS